MNERKERIRLLQSHFGKKNREKEKKSGEREEIGRKRRNWEKDKKLEGKEEIEGNIRNWKEKKKSREREKIGKNDCYLNKFGSKSF